MTRWTVSLATVMVMFFLGRSAAAQRLVSGGGIGIGTGLQRSDLIEEGLFQRARTRIVVPFDFRNDEDMSQGIALVGIFEIEPKVGIGLEARYVRWLGKAFSGFVGIPAIIAPKTLVGVDVGVDLSIPLGKSGVALFVEPSLAAIPLGTDLPGDHVLLWALVSVGVHAQF
ncbi:MAG TPA: hypothetical protein VK550_15365 [Polyangiaceae bacterium]|jgi:hypothetical protein|nr:hypothetical protein [Polyangiaceae bacterium]